MIENLLWLFELWKSFTPKRIFGYGSELFFDWTRNWHQPIWILVYFWLISNLRILLANLSLWQKKEYRLDRVEDHLKTKEGKKEIFDSFFFLKLFLFAFGSFVFILLPSPRADQELVVWLMGVVLGLESVYFFWRLLQRQTKRPDFTKKVFLILLTTLVFQFLSLGLWGFIIFFSPTMFLMPQLLIFAFMALAVALWSLPSRLATRVLVARAKKKILQFPDLKVIGITGSFGKTSTKEFLKTILSSKYKVLATSGRQNTLIGVARQILNELEGSHQVYVVEMAAYKKGEIKAIADLVSPQIGIITGLGNQHLSLFGSMDNLLAAKFELIEALPEKGLAIFNADTPLCEELIKKTRVKRTIYSTQNKRANFYGDQIKVSKEKLRLKVKSGLTEFHLEAKLLGQQNASNLLAAVAAAFSLWSGGKRNCSSGNPDQTFAWHNEVAGWLQGLVFGR